MEIILNGNELTRNELINIAFGDVKVKADTSKLKKSRDFVEKKVNEGEIVYGITTGFGSNVDKHISKENAEALQINLLRSHACGTGDYFQTEISRAIMIIRLNTLLKGYSGIRLSTVKQLEFFINNGLTPLIPSQGSVGASGDLCPLSHMALPLLGEGEVEFRGKHYKTQEFMKTAEAAEIGYKPVSLSYKEGLALNNGTTVMTAVAAVAVAKARRLFKVALMTTGLIYEALGVRRDAFAFDLIHQIRHHDGQIKTASILKKLLDGSHMVGITQQEIIDNVLKNKLIKNEKALELLKKIDAEKDPGKQEQISDKIIYILRADGEDAAADILAYAKKKWKPQNSYSIRCVPQVFGATLAALDHITDIVSNELNAACDNPLIFADEGKAISGGNFHGQPIALVMDYLKLAMSEIGDISERQICKMVDSATNDCLPSFLVGNSGLNSGLMITQYVAAAVASENKVLVHPASADSIPTCENTEDHVSMGTTAARQALEIINNVEKINAVGIMAALYGVTLRLDQFKSVGFESEAKKVLSPAMYDFYMKIRKISDIYKDESFLKNDRFLAPELRAFRNHLPDFEAVADKYFSID